MGGMDGTRASHKQCWWGGGGTARRNWRDVTTQWRTRLGALWWRQAPNANADCLRFAIRYRSALASSGLCIGRADEWDRRQKKVVLDDGGATVFVGMATTAIMVGMRMVVAFCGVTHPAALGSYAIGGLGDGDPPASGWQPAVEPPPLALR